MGAPEPTVRIVCNCKACSGKAARVRKSYADAERMDATRIHNLVQMAHGPLSMAPQIRANGPWKDDSQ